MAAYHDLRPAVVPYSPSCQLVFLMPMTMHFTSFAFITVWPLSLIPLVVGVPLSLFTATPDPRLLAQ